jgi:hypothetical protein
MTHFLPRFIDTRRENRINKIVETLFPLDVAVASAVIIIRSRSICDRPSDRIYPHSPQHRYNDAMWRPSSLNPILAGALRNLAKSSHLFYRVVAFTFHWNCNARSCPRYVKYSFHYWHWEIRRISAIQMGPNKKGRSSIKPSQVGWFRLVWSRFVANANPPRETKITSLFNH